ncbi:S10 family peptidase [Pectobacterium brasiliense]|uniref:S10 family peptidase n=1 Tax=Pectobacterium brasiliense TaxID=180957 RepID=UPI001968F6D5|nr:hypothetical protein [Pectobacterium brasiliense]
MTRFLSLLFFFPFFLYGDERSHNADFDPLHYQVNKSSVTEGRVTINHKRINYEATAGVLELNKADPAEPTIDMFYVAYFKKRESTHVKRAITFIFNGGPGSASLWLHMGAVGPKRILAPQPGTAQLAPYTLTDNQYSLLNVSDLVFIDAPGTGYSRFSSQAIDQRERDEQRTRSANSVYGVNGDAQAFSQFIVQFLTHYQRWNSPKYLFGESYGTTRAVLLAQELKHNNVDINGIILMSQFLNYDNNIDDPELNPGIDQPYILSLPTYAASAWYHNQLPGKHPELKTFLNEAEQFAQGPYAQALLLGANLPEKQRQSVANQLYHFTGISADFWIRANLRIKGPVFAGKLLSDKNETIGRLDSRYRGSSLDNMGASADYDPNVSALTSPYLASFHDYLATTLNYRADHNYQVFTDAIQHWNMSGNSRDRAFNVLPNLARIMKLTPSMKVMVIGGIYDMATPYFTAKYDMSHLPISNNLRKNITFSWYETGHMPYIDESALKKMHTDLSEFISQK